MNKDYYTGLFFGGIFMALCFAFTSLYDLEGLAILIYYVLLAFAMVINDLIDKFEKKKKVVRK